MYEFNKKRIFSSFAFIVSQRFAQSLSTFRSCFFLLFSSYFFRFRLQNFAKFLFISAFVGESPAALTQRDNRNDDEINKNKVSKIWRDLSHFLNIRSTSGVNFGSGRL
jgi:hypothetical protein